MLAVTESPWCFVNFQRRRSWNFWDLVSGFAGSKISYPYLVSEQVPGNKSSTVSWPRARTIPRFSSILKKTDVRLTVFQEIKVHSYILFSLVEYSALYGSIRYTTDTPFGIYVAKHVEYLEGNWALAYTTTLIWYVVYKYSMPRFSCINH